MYYDILIHTCMKQDQSYFKQVFYLREYNFGLNIKKDVALEITCKIVAFVYRKLSFTFRVIMGIVFFPYAFIMSILS